MVRHRRNLLIDVLLLVVAAAIVAAVDQPPRCPSGCTCDDPLSLNCGIGYKGNEFPGLDNTSSAIGADKLLAVFLAGSCGRYLSNVSAIPYTSVTQLTLDNCALGSTLTSGSFAHLSQLTSLSVVGNSHLNTLEVAVFDGLVNLETLELNGNDLVDLPANLFRGLVRLRFLDLSFNPRIASLPADLFGADLSVPVPNLNTLICNSCTLSDVPTALLKRLPGLNRLELNENRLMDALAKTGRRPFESLTKLGELSLDMSELTALAVDSFAGLENSMQTLRLGHNAIVRVTVGTVSRLKNLNRLELNDNSLTVLDRSALPDGLLNTSSSSHPKPSMQLGRNPWQCDGKEVSLVWMKKLLDLGLIISDVEQVVCLTPANLKGMPLHYVHEETLTGTDSESCSKQTRSSSAIIVALVFSSLGLVLVSVAFVYRFCALRRRRSSSSRYGNVTLYSKPSVGDDDA